MCDREKVINEFKERISVCSMIGDGFDVTINWRLADDILALLKEQEAVEPIPPEDEFGLYRCGKCHHQLFRCVDKYCSRCGKAVKRECVN